MQPTDMAGSTISCTKKWIDGFPEQTLAEEEGSPLEEKQLALSWVQGLIWDWGHV